MSLVVLGTVAIDHIITPKDEKPFVLGGSAYHLALASSFFVPEIYLLASIGNDYPESSIKEMNARGIKTDGIQRYNDVKTFFWKGQYLDDMNSRETHVTELNSLEKFEPVLPPEYQQGKHLMLANIHPAIQLEILQKFEKRPEFVVADTMNLWIEIERKKLIELIAQIDLICLNNEEATQLTGKSSLLKAAQEIMNYGVPRVIIKKGEHGAIYFEKKFHFSIPAFLLDEVSDPTGAGDVFIGAFIGTLIQKKKMDRLSIKDSLIMGSVMASFGVQDFGPAKILNLQPAEIEKRKKQFLESISVL